MTIPAILILTGACIAAIGAIIVALGTFWNTTKQEHDKAKSAEERLSFEQELRKKGDEQILLQIELRDKSDQMATLYQEIAKTQGDLRKKADLQVTVQKELRAKSEEIANLNGQIAKAQSELRNKSDEIAELNRYTTKAIIGGDSFCWVDLLVTSHNTFDIMLDHKGEFPLYDISIRMWEPENYRDLPAGKFNETMNTKDFFSEPGNLSPNSAQTLGTLTVPDKDKVNFAVTIIMRNGSVQENLRLRKVKGIWKRAYRVYKYINNNKEIQVLEEWGEDGFPRDENGKITW